MTTENRKQRDSQSVSHLNKRKFTQSPEMEIRIKNGVAVITGHTDNQETGLQTALALGTLGSIEKVFNLVQVDS